MYNKILVLIFLGACGISSNAQWGLAGASGRTNATVPSIGIGLFPNQASILSRLHVNNFLCNTPTGSLNGFLFRTDGNQTVDNRWQLFTGTSSTAQTERFRIRTLANGFDTYLERTQVGSEADLRLLTAEVQLRARNKRLGAFCELAGETLADVVQFGDNTNVNIFNHAQTIALVPRGTSWWGTSGTMRSGQFYMIHAPQNVQVDAIIPDVPQNGIGNLHNGDVYFQGRCASDTLTYIRMQNGTLLNGLSVPALIGYNNSNSNHGLAISGKINPTNDIVNINGPAVIEIDGRIGDNVVADNVVTNRMLFRVCNFNVAEMSMEASGQVGLRTNTPNNRLEIKSVLGDPYFGNIEGSSGLRFTNLTSANTPLTTSTNGVLSVDANGDVIYVSATGLQCDWNLIGTDDLATGYATACRTGKVTIGANTGTAKFSSFASSSEGVAIYGQSNQTAINYGVYGRSASVVAEENVGVRGEAFGGNKCFGGYFRATNSNSPNCYGSYSEANNTAPGGSNVGANGIAGGAASNIGLFGEANANESSFSTGVYATYTGSGAANWAVYANGSSFAMGGTWQTSDAKLKKDIEPIQNATDIIMQLQPKKYLYKTSEYKVMNLPEGTQSGLIAQDLEKLVPEAVRQTVFPAQYDIEGKKLSEEVSFSAVNYIALIPYLIQTLKEQEEKIKSLEAKMDISSTSVLRSSESETDDFEKAVVLSNNTIILNQNVPNPFAEQTTIKYNITEDFTKAQILFYDANGKLIQSTDITVKGEGQLNVFADDLTSGTYSYALVVDGKVIETKKMLKL